MVVKVKPGSIYMTESEKLCVVLSKNQFVKNGLFRCALIESIQTRHRPGDNFMVTAEGMHSKGNSYYNIKKIIK